MVGSGVLDVRFLGMIFIFLVCELLEVIFVGEWDLDLVVKFRCGVRGDGGCRFIGFFVGFFVGFGVFLGEG